MKKLLNKILFLAIIFTCNTLKQSNAARITNLTDKIILVKKVYDQIKCAKIIHLGSNINPNEFFCPIIKIESQKSQTIGFLPEDFIEKIVIEVILQKNLRLIFNFKASLFKDFNEYFLTISPDAKTTFNLDGENYESSSTTWTLKISPNKDGNEGNFSTTTPEEISNSY